MTPTFNAASLPRKLAAIAIWSAFAGLSVLAFLYASAFVAGLIDCAICTFDLG